MDGSPLLLALLNSPHNKSQKVVFYHRKKFYSIPQRCFFMENSLLMHIGDKVRKIREMKGYSQEWVASQLNMVQTNYSKIERGETKDMTVKRLAEIAKVLEVDAAAILNFDEKQVFNSTFNNQSGNQGDNIVLMKNTFEQMKEQYEARIRELKEEVAFLRDMCKGKQ